MYWRPQIRSGRFGLLDRRPVQWKFQSVIRIMAPKTAGRKSDQRDQRMSLQSHQSLNGS